MGPIRTFFTAFAERDWTLMGACYHDGARFNDRIFHQLEAREGRAMGRLRLNGVEDLRLAFLVLEENAGSGRVRWNAWYTTNGGRRVHDRVTSTFAFKDGLILRQDDQFDFGRWSRQVLGLNGLLLGWTTWLRDEVRKGAMVRIRKSPELAGPQGTTF